MKNWVKCASLALAFLLAGCTAPRVSTADERAMADAAIATAETGIIVAAAAGKLSAVEFDQAMALVAELRAAVAASETTPGSWLTLYQRALNLAAQWAVAQQAKPPS